MGTHRWCVSVFWIYQVFALQGFLGADQDRVCCASVSEMGVHKT